MTKTVFIEGLRLHLRCGVYSEERAMGVQVKVDVRVTSEAFVDYQKLYAVLLDIAGKSTFTYIEDFAERVIEEVRRRWKPSAVEVVVSKLSVPFQHSFESAGVKLRWSGGGASL